MRRVGCLLLLVLTAAAPADPKDVAVRALDVKVQPRVKGRATEPVTINSAEELARAVPDEAAAAAVKMAVNFDKEKVNFFAWAGSGQDRITFATGTGRKGPEVTFTYAPGRSRDARSQSRLFALPKGDAYQVVTGGR